MSYTTIALADLTYDVAGHLADPHPTTPDDAHAFYAVTGIAPPDRPDAEIPTGLLTYGLLPLAGIALAAYIAHARATLPTGDLALELRLTPALIAALGRYLPLLHGARVAGIPLTVIEEPPAIPTHLTARPILTITLTTTLTR